MNTSYFLHWLQDYLLNIDNLDSHLLTIKSELELVLAKKKKKIKYSPSYLSCLIDIEEGEENTSELIPF